MEIQEIITKTVKEAVKEFRMQKIIKEDRSYYSKTEILLYNYKNLLNAVQQKQEDIDYIRDNGLPEKSKGIVMYSTNSGNISPEERYMNLIEKYEYEIAETQREISRIENALNKVRTDKYFPVIEMRYFTDENLKDEQIAEVLEKDQSTVSRNRKRLVKSIMIMLFPESIQEL